MSLQPYSPTKRTAKATKYRGQCEVPGCPWHFESPRAALIAELYGNHFGNAHPGLTGALHITPAPPVEAKASPDSQELVIPCPPASYEELVRLHLKEPSALTAARARKRDRLVGIVTLVGAVAMLAVGVALVTSPGWLAAVPGQGSDVVWLTLLGAVFALSAPGAIALIRSGTAFPYRRLAFAAVVLAACLEVLIAGSLTLGTIGVADMDVNGQLSTSFVNWWVLEWGLSYAFTPALVIAAVQVKNRGAIAST